MLSIDLHPIFRNNRDIDTVLRTFVLRAAAGGHKTAEIICGQGSGKLRERTLTYLRQPHVAKHHAGAHVDPGNDGRIILRF